MDHSRPFCGALPVRTTPRLMLRPLGPTDEVAIQRLLGNAEIVGRHRDGVLEKQETRQYLWDWIDHCQEHGFGGFAVIEAGSYRVVGLCGLRFLSPSTGIVEMQHFFTPEARSLGYEQEALRITLDFAFDTLELDAVFALLLANDDLRQNTLTELGMTFDQSWQLEGQEYVTLTMPSNDWRAQSSANPLSLPRSEKNPSLTV